MSSFLHALFLLLAFSLVPVTAQQVPTRDAARRLLDRNRHEQAIEAYRRIAEAHPESALAWFDLAQAHHLAGDYARAHEVGRRAAAFDDFRATCLYNLACASALLGEVDRAADELDQALAAGFLDYDLLAVDADLASLREAGRIELPPAHRYEVHRHNRVEIPYRVLLPEGYDDEQAYPAAVVFSPGGMGKRSTDWTLETLWGDATARQGWILVLAAQPGNGWINHPSHHALESLMKAVRKQHRVEDDRFHFVGLGAGARPAATYSGMSSRSVRSVVLVDSVAYLRWDDDEVAGLARRARPPTFVVGTGAGPTQQEVARVRELVNGAGGRLVVDEVETPGPALLAVDGARLLALLSGG